MQPNFFTLYMRTSRTPTKVHSGIPALIASSLELKIRWVTLTLGNLSRQHFFVKVWLNKTILRSVEGFWCLRPQTPRQWGKTKSEKKKKILVDKTRPNRNWIRCGIFAWSDRAPNECTQRSVSGSPLLISTSTDLLCRSHQAWPTPCVQWRGIHPMLVVCGERKSQRFSSTAQQLTCNRDAGMKNDISHMQTSEKTSKLVFRYCFQASHSPTERGPVQMHTNVNTQSLSRWYGEPFHFS